MNTAVKIKPMPLSDRLRRLGSYHPAHPEFPACAVQALAETPIAVFLAGFPDARDELAYVLDIDIAVLEQMNYQEVAEAIYPFWLARHDNIVAETAISLLASPFVYIDSLPKRGDTDEG